MDTRHTMSRRLVGKVALVTGATGGIGLAISELFLQEGATVHLTDIDPGRGERLVSRLGDRARFHVLDVTDETGWAATISRLERAGDQLTTLVNCAGTALRRRLVDTSSAEFRRLVELNLTGTFLGVRTAGQHLIDGGSIVNISSLNGVLPTAGLGAYVASKAAVSALTRVAALEFADRGITVNAVCPGSIDTAITDGPDFADLDWEAYVRAIPLNRRGTAEEVAQAVLYLASDDSRYVTGVNLTIDGGIAAGRRAT
jgi:NAD(P)-dependent dehydrogenase (short-subunit alcohol dehydrogenase family)